MERPNHLSRWRTFLSLFVLAALVVTGVVIGLAVVYYYNDLANLFN